MLPDLGSSPELDPKATLALEAAERALALSRELRLRLASDPADAVADAEELGRRGAELRPLVADLLRPGAERRIQVLDAHAENLSLSAARAAAAAARGDRAEALDRVELGALPMADGLVSWLGRERSLILGPEAVRAERERMIDRVRRVPEAPGEGPYAFEASVFVVGYNKVEYTRLCVENLLRHTDLASGRVELILVDNGSTDATRSFLRSVPGARVVELDRNTGPLGGFAAASVAARGEFLVGVANDVIPTPRWLEQLLACVRSDRRVVQVAPVSNSISNRQAIPVDYGNDLGSLEAFAERHNRSDPSRWEERCRLMPFVYAVPRRLIELGFRFDPIYSQGEFVDDDQSSTFRRAGLRQLLAGDTFLHHFGSVTLGEAQRASRSLENMRATYRAKWGVDAWEGADALTEFKSLLQQLALPVGASILAVEPLFGDTHLLAREALARSGRPPGPSDAVVFDRRFLDDARPWFRRVFEGGLEGVEAGYDLVLVCRELGELAPADPVGALLACADCLAPGGHLLARVANAQSVPHLLQQLQPRFGKSAIDARATLPLISAERLVRSVQSRGFRIQVVNVLARERSADVQRLAEILMKVTPGGARSLESWLAGHLAVVIDRPR